MAGVTDSERETHLRDLAERMQFRMEKSGERFTLTRTADLSRPERETDLTLDEVAATAVFLASDAASGITGQAVSIDGGTAEY